MVDFRWFVVLMKRHAQALSPQKKKARALQAINDSLRLQLSKHESVQHKTTDEPQRDEKSVSALGGARDNVRTWSRFTSSGISPCKNVSATSAQNRARVVWYRAKFWRQA